MDTVRILGQLLNNKRRIVGFLIAIFVPIVLLIGGFRIEVFPSFTRDIIGLMGIVVAVNLAGMYAGILSASILLFSQQVDYMTFSGTSLPPLQVLLDAILLLVIIYRANKVFSRGRKMKKLALHDELTGLPNRRAILPVLAEACQLNQGTNRKSVLMFVDLDFFKAVNDTFGHPAGDYILVHFGRRLREVIRPSDVAARIGGDEFMVLLPHAIDKTRITLLAKRILKKVTKEYLFEGKSIIIGASIGIATCPVDALDSEKLIEIADQRLYVAKESGRNMAFDGKRKIVLKS